ncbi:hypothetical protein BDZ89DRAFT_1067105 [Hymenopellis radicata]|nr:hypothetical protein BDZ89DRAFT_1067105 [Hymenopellis radicata]
MAYNSSYPYSAHYAHAPSAPAPQYAHDVEMADASGTRYDSEPPPADYEGERVPGHQDHRANQHFYGTLWSPAPRHPPGLQRPRSPISRWTPSTMFYGSDPTHRDFDANFLFDSIGEVPMGDPSHTSQPSRGRGPPAYSEYHSTARPSESSSHPGGPYHLGRRLTFAPEQEFIPIPTVDPNELVNAHRSNHGAPRRGNTLSSPLHIEHNRGPATQRRNKSKRERDTPHPSAGILPRSQDITSAPTRSALIHLYPLVPSQIPVHLILDVTESDKLYSMDHVGSARTVFTAAQEEGNFFAYHRLRNALVAAQYTPKVFVSEELRPFLTRNGTRFMRQGLRQLNQLRTLGSHSQIGWMRELHFRHLPEHGNHGSALPPCPAAPYRAPSCAKGNAANFTAFVNHTLIHGSGTAMNGVLFTEDRIDVQTLMGAFYERQLIPNGGETRHKPSTDKARVYYACLTSYPPMYDRLRADHGIVVSNRVDYAVLDADTLPNLTFLDFVRQLALRGWTAEMLAVGQPWGIRFLIWASHPQNKLAREIREIATEGLLRFAIEVQVNGLPRRWDEVQTHGPSRLPPDLFAVPTVIHFDREVYKERRLRLTLGYSTRGAGSVPVVGNQPAPPNFPTAPPVPPPIIALAGPSISQAGPSTSSVAIARPASAPPPPLYRSNSAPPPPYHPSSNRDDGNEDASMTDSDPDSAELDDPC